MTWRPFLVALLLPLLFTALVLFDVQRNRRTERQPITLTEREVTLDTGTQQSSGATAWLNWAADQAPGERWLSREQLAALGFDVTVAPNGADADRAYSRQLPRRAYVVLLLTGEGRARSRLVPVDAGTDRDRLLAQYPDGRTHIVTAGTVSIRRIAVPGRVPYADGYLVNIDPRGLHIPSEFRDRLPRDVQRGRSFSLVVRYGGQLAPRVVDVR